MTDFTFGPVAKWLRQLAHNESILGSNPSRPTAPQEGRNKYRFFDPGESEKACSCQGLVVRALVGSECTHYPHSYRVSSPTVKTPFLHGGDSRFKSLLTHLGVWPNPDKASGF